MKLNVREMELDEVHFMINYFLDADHEYISGLGVDSAKLPEFDQWYEILRQDFGRPIEKKKFYYLIWEIAGNPVGHSHINDIVFAKEAFMHLHIWKPGDRKSGSGTIFVRESVKRYFELFDLSRLYCQPNVNNPAPNHTLQKVGFEFLKTYETTPSWINFHQQVNLWVMDCVV